MFMNINNISPSMPSMSMPNISGEGSDKLKSLEQKLQQLETEKQKAIQSKDKEKEEKIKKQIEKIQKQIQEIKQTQQKGQESCNTSSDDIKKRVDTYEAQPPQQSAGVYQVTHDENGQKIIQVDKSCETAQGQPKANPQDEREKPNIVKTTVNTDKVDKEIEKLKQTQTQLEQKIAAAKEPKEKEKLEAQLAQVNAELKAKDNDTYRQQHMEITEQKVVSKVGE